MPHQPTETKQNERESGLPDTACSTFVQRFAYRPHPNPKIKKMLPDELQVGWEFEERATGEKRFVHWGSTKNRETLSRLIEDVKEKQGITEVVALSS